jgi:hypothetical protein
MNSQARIQNQINLHNQKKKWSVQIEHKWCDELNNNNLKHKLYTACNLWEKAPLPSL